MSFPERATHSAFGSTSCGGGDGDGGSDGDGDGDGTAAGRLINDHNSSVALMSALSRETVLILRVRGEDSSVRHSDYRTPE